MSSTHGPRGMLACDCMSLQHSSDSTSNYGRHSSASSWSKGSPKHKVACQTPHHRTCLWRCMLFIYGHLHCQQERHLSPVQRRFGESHLEANNKDRTEPEDIEPGRHVLACAKSFKCHTYVKRTAGCSTPAENESCPKFSKTMAFELIASLCMDQHGLHGKNGSYVIALSCHSQKSL